MITVNCSQCKAKLEMDDAFAGGVCRCHYCGTIQSVPANARKKSAPPVAAAGGNHRGGTAPSSGLDQLADVVASSGLSQRASRAAPAPAAPAAQPVDYARPPQQKKMTLPLVIALGVIALLLALVGFLIIGGSTTTQVVVGPGAPPPPLNNPGGGGTADGGTTPVPESGGGSGDGGGSGGTDPAPQTPHFCGISLENASSVAYVLDSGHSTAELFDTLKVATYRSIESLKPGQKFQIVFWDNGNGVASYPAAGLADATDQQVEAARNQFADLVAGGSAEAESAVAHAAASRPAAIVLVTAKAFALEPELIGTVRDAVKGSNTKVHTIALRGDDGSTVLRSIAQQTGGDYRPLTGTDLRTYSN